MREKENAGGNPETKESAGREGVTKKQVKPPFLTRKRGVCIAVAAALVLCALVAFFVAQNRLTAKIMRILRIEGTVALEENGQTKTIMDNLRLQDGSALSTKAQSLAMVGLDEYKIVTLEENSRAEFKKRGKALELFLTEGRLFFEVKKKLGDDERFDVRTSTMLVGIRGTSGYINTDDEGHVSLIVTDGEVSVTGVNPDTGEEKETTVSSGQKLVIYLYDRAVDSVMFFMEPVTEATLPDEAVRALSENEALLDKVCQATGWNRELILSRAGAPQDKGEILPESAQVQAADSASLGAGGTGSGAGNGGAVKGD